MILFSAFATPFDQAYVFPPVAVSEISVMVQVIAVSLVLLVMDAVGNSFTSNCTCVEFSYG